MLADVALASELRALEEHSLRRVRRTVGGAQGPEVLVNGRRVLCFASNNYLGLADDERLRRAAIDALESSGTGSGASPLVSGHMAEHEALEREIAAWLGCEAALVFGSGYHANVAVIPALAGAEDEVFSDALNHASLIDGCRLARARVTVFPHRDLGALERALGASRARRKLVVCDSIFSMDGDAMPLAELVALAERHGAWTMLDEAHATGVFGASSAGLAEAEGVGERVTVRMGTLGKALGGYGAFVAGSRDLIETLVNRARAYVFSTALPPSIVAAARAAIAIVRAEPELRERLWRNARRMHAALAAAGLDPAPLASPILPLVAGESRAALRVAAHAFERGILAPAIRPPTVPAGTARLRVTPMATHDGEQIDRAAAVLVEAFRRAR
ncbi:MAG TPA: 8-amino-7-oxononanoate synthase [Candidatus Bathyarchaeia archaeon]|nr:8-amino-7-oxononanoate synthase [Candidatus Bathyarchaeia archaeon]